MVNKVVGEIKIKLGEAEHILRPTYAALAEVESELGGIVMLAQKFEAGDLSLRDFTVIIMACLKVNSPNGAEGISEDEIGDAVIKEGMMRFVGPLSQLLGAALSGAPRKDDKDAAKNG